MNYLDYLSALDVVHWIPRKPSLTDALDSASETGAPIELVGPRSANEFKVKSACDVSDSTVAPEEPVIKVPRAVGNLVSDQAALPENVADLTHDSRTLGSIQPKGAGQSETVQVEKAVQSERAARANEVARFEDSAQSREVASDNASKPTSINKCFLVAPASQQWQQGGLLVLCRHQAEQPAASFLNRSRPSKTVQNLIGAINWLVVDSDSLSEHSMPPVMLAQVASTALSDDACDLQEILRQHQPKAMLLLGAATANHLTGEQRSAAEWSLKSWHFDFGIPFVVTHHPYELFSDPLLKKQAWQQLLQLRPIILNESSG